MELMDRIENYWTDRAASYSEENLEELRGSKWPVWLDIITSHMPNKNKEEIRVLDIGTGPGFFTILLARDGYQMTAIDYTEEMLMRAKENAKMYLDNITFKRMNADELEFEDNTFDLIINRNVTWTLKDPVKAYTEWLRVLKPNGKIMIFDANWYNQLFDLEMRRGYESDRQNALDKGINDGYVGTNIDEMESIARQLPLSPVIRPDWDQDAFTLLNASKIEIDREIYKRVWTEEEMISYASTPMFLIVCTK